MTTWTLLFVIIRLYANSRAPRGLGIDDCKIDILLTLVVQISHEFRLLYHRHDIFYFTYGGDAFK